MAAVWSDMFVFFQFDIKELDRNESLTQITNRSNIQSQYWTNMYLEAPTTTLLCANSNMT